MKSIHRVVLAIAMVLTFACAAQATPRNSYDVDNVTVGASPISGSGTLLLLGFGLVGLVGVRRVASGRKV
ncbi:hypothetical protein N1030_01165 [Desulfovibrio mangrovi]|uniref:hypothetical protein n=1 Tax=Desulfovibrio mangrovi TaxID=2976983 RepID=UPI0022467194|nr:hypothetical protein [Desulfovibrio mangrovi]UZP67604.1 hypothetical protein N1030_01165 [Desulfovibrio mangrovi]